jgi:hypothetical protein
MGYTVDEITLNSYFLIFFPYFSPWFNFNPTSLHRVFKAGSGWLGALGLGENHGGRKPTFLWRYYGFSAL